MLTPISNQEEYPLKDDLKKEFVGVGRTFTEIWVLVHAEHIETCARKHIHNHLEREECLSYFF